MNLQERMLQLEQLMLDIDSRLNALERHLTARGHCMGPDLEHQVKPVRA